MFSAILILLLLPSTDVSRSRGMQCRPLSKGAFFVFVANFLILMQLAAKHVESPFIEFGQISTVLYFLYFTVVMYGVTVIENTFVELNNSVVEYNIPKNVALSTIIPATIGNIRGQVISFLFFSFLVICITSLYNKSYYACLL